MCADFTTEFVACAKMSVDLIELGHKMEYKTAQNTSFVRRISLVAWVTYGPGPLLVSLLIM